MRSLRPLACEFVLVLLAASAAAQTPPSDPIAGVLKALGEADRPGPVIMVLPGMRMQNANVDDGLLKIATVGGLTALVPKTMVNVDSRPPEVPNLYDGLPQDAKVMYLLTTLDSGQWARATSDGIGKGDLRGEQVAVFESLLPNPLRYSMGKLTDDGGRHSLEGIEGVKTLPAAERDAIRIKVVRELWMQVAMKNDGGWSARDLPEDEKPGTLLPSIEETKDGEYGRTILVRSNNILKKSDLSLDDPRLAKSVPLVPNEPAKSLLDRVAKATGLRLDVAQGLQYRMVAERGGSVPARDLLGALALGLCGTFRRVGGGYVLTNDLLGMAAHQARIALWEDAYKKELDRRKGEWRASIAKNPAFRTIRYHGTLAEGLTSEERANLERNDGPNGNPVFIPTSQASPVVQRTLKGLKNDDELDREKVGLSSNVRYEILLPGMGRAWWRGWLDNVDQYARQPSSDAPADPKPVATPLDPKGGLAGIALRAESPAQARAAVASAVRHGAPVLLLETRNPEALRTAVAAGKAANLPVGLLLRPWNLAPGERLAEPDRNVAGEHGAILAATERGNAALQRHYVDRTAYPPPVSELVAPLDPATGAHVQAAAALAATPGLAQVAVLDLYPTGYAREDSRSFGSYYYSPPIDAYLSYGYTDALRAAHLAAKGLDPLDIDNQMVRVEIDLNPAWNGGYDPQQGFEDWQKTRGAASHARAVALAKALLAAAPGVPVRLPGEPPQTNLPPLRSVYLYDLKSADTLPVADVDYGANPQPAEAAERTVLVLDDPDPVAFMRNAGVLATSLAKPNRPLFLDLTAVAPARSETVLSRWIKVR